MVKIFSVFLTNLQNFRNVFSFDGSSEWKNRARMYISGSNSFTTKAGIETLHDFIHKYIYFFFIIYSLSLLKMKTL